MAVIHSAVMWRSPVGNSATGTRQVELKGYGKVNSPAFPHTVANEFVASRLADRLGLPVPAGALIPGDAEDEPLAWVSLAFTGETPPPVDPAAVAAAQPSMAAAVLVFDLLIANTDRHAGNLHYRGSNGLLYVYDHSHALLGTESAVPAYLDLMRDSFAIDGAIRGNRHCLLDHVATAALVQASIDEVCYSLKDPFLKRVSEEVRDLALVGADDAERLMAFLSHRRDNLKKLVADHHGEFKAIAPKDWGLGI